MKNGIILLIFLNILVNIRAQKWSAVGTGMNDVVLTLASYKGELYAGGYFSIAGGIQAKNIAKWDETTWSEVGNGIDAAYVDDLLVFNQELFVSGMLLSAGGNYVSQIAKWDGLEWSSVGWPDDFYMIKSLAVYDGSLYAGGIDRNFNGFVSKWNGTGWNFFTLTNGSVLSLVAFNGELYAGGGFTTDGTLPCNFIAKWDGTSWASVGSGMNKYITKLTVFNGELYAGGGFSQAGENSAMHITKWDGTNWSNIGGGVDSTVFSLLSFNETLFVGGEFNKAGDLPIRFFASWDGSKWSAVGSGMNNSVRTSAIFNGKLYIGGFFSSDGTNATNYISRLDTFTNTAGILKDEEVNIFPNPCSEKLNIYNPNISTIELKMFDVMGSQVFIEVNKSNIGLTEIDVSNLNKGMYILKLKIDKKIYYKQIVKN